MDEKHLQYNPEAIVWVWNIAFAMFFTFVRIVVKQEFKNPWAAVITGFISLVTAIFIGHLVELWGGPEWLIRCSIALSSLIVYDLIKAILSFSSKVDGNVIWSIIRAYTGKADNLPEDLPSKADKPAE